MQAPAQPAAAQQFDSVTSVTEFDSAASRPRVGEQLRALEFERDATRTSSAPVLRELADDRNVARTSRAHSTAEQRTQQRKRRRERLKKDAEELKVSECMHAFVVVHARSSRGRRGGGGGGALGEQLWLRQPARPMGRVPRPAPGRRQRVWHWGQQCYRPHYARRASAGGCPVCANVNVLTCLPLCHPICSY